jgi:dTMP kinase
MLITFEGIDGSGKTTQVRLFSQFLEQQNKKYIVLREPGGTPFSEEVRSILLHSKNKISPLSELFLFNAARADLVENVIRPELQSGTIVVCDRFFDSTTAYQGFGRKLPLEDVTNCNRIATNGLTPDLTFFLDIPLDMAISRRHKKQPDRMELAGDDFFESVVEGFRKLAELHPNRFYRIDSAGTIEESHNLIIKKYMEKITLA